MKPNQKVDEVKAVMGKIEHIEKLEREISATYEEIDALGERHGEINWASSARNAVHQRAIARKAAEEAEFEIATFSFETDSEGEYVLSD